MAEGRRSSQRYLSGRSKIIGFSGLSTDRHLYVEPGQVEPNLGFPGEKSLPVSSTYYKLITVDNGTTFDRYWQEDTPATLVNGISIFDEGVLVGTANTVSKLNFVGAAVTATASGTISTITVTPVSISTLAPPNPRSGELWWDSDEGELNVYYQDINSAQWVLANSGIGTTSGSGGGGGGGGGGSGGANVTVSSNPPTSPTPANGDLWWDSDIGELYIYYTDGDSNQWVETSGGSETVTISDNAPPNPNDGDLWWESDTGSLKIYYNDGDSQQWVDANAGVLSSLSSFIAWSTNSAGIHTTSNVGIGTTNVSAVDSSNTAVLAVGIVTAYKYYGDGSNLTGISGGGASVTVSTGAPSSPSAGDLWWDSDDGDLLVYFNDGNSSQWVSTNSGATGAQGAQGATGGAQGAVGAQGATGSSGSAGAQGAQGATGSTGAQGATGSGSAGAQGATGSTGAQGATGTGGSTGAQGAQGVAGSAASQGAQGAQGHQGAAGGGGGSGAQGAQGHQGTAGAQGGLGATGAQGDGGSTGATGPQGAQGASGSGGSSGSTGAQGAQGATGSGGSTGAQGAQGYQGATGSGSTGAQGAQGHQGAGGSTGSQGATGPLSSRSTNSGTTTSLAQTAYQDMVLTTAGKTCALLKVQISAPAWVILYVDAASRTSDNAGSGSGRSEGTDPTPGSGVLAEVSTTTSGASTFLMSPGLIAWNNDSTPAAQIYARVYNKRATSGSNTITVTLTTVKLEA